MKKHGFAGRVLAIFLCVALMMTALTGCTGSTKIHLGDRTVPGGVLAYYYGYYYLGLYNSTEAETIAGIALNQVQQYAAIDKLCDENEIELEPLERKDVLDSINQEVASYGGEDAFNIFLKGCDLNMKQYREMMYLLSKSEKLQKKLFDQETGSRKLSDQEVIDYFMEHFLHLQIIFTVTAACESNEEYEAAEELANDLYWEVKNGGDPEAVGQKAQEEHPSGKGGPYVSYTDAHLKLSELESGVQAAVSELEVGDCTPLLTTTNGYYVITRVENDEQYASDNVATYYSEASSAAMQALLHEQIDNMPVNEKDLDQVNLDAAVESWYVLYSALQSTSSATGSILDYLG